MAGALPIRTHYLALDDVSPAGPPADGQLGLWSEALGHMVWIDPATIIDPLDDRYAVKATEARVEAAEGRIEDAESAIAGLDGRLDVNESDIANLQAGKADAVHTHTLADVSDAGTIASQAANAVVLTGGSISGVSLTVGTGAIAVSATDWGLQIPTMPGPPTGVPAVTPGLAPVTVDSTSGRIWTHAGGQSRAMARAVDVEAEIAALRSFRDAISGDREIVAWDNFDRPNGPLGLLPSGQTWVGSGWEIQNKGARRTSGGIATIPIGRADSVVKVFAAQGYSTVHTGAILAWVDAQNYIWAGFRQTWLRIAKVVGGVETPMQTTSTFAHRINGTEVAEFTAGVRFRAGELQISASLETHGVRHEILAMTTDATEYDLFLTATRAGMLAGNGFSWIRGFSVRNVEV